MSRKIVLKADPFQIVSAALDNAVVSALNKTDKWCVEPLTEAQRSVLRTQLPNYFWANLEEAGVELQ